MGDPAFRLRGLSPGYVWGPEICFVFAMFTFTIKVSMFNFENDAIKLSFNKAKWAGLCARNCATNSAGLISKFSFGLEKFLGLSRNGPLYLSFACSAQFFRFFFASSAKPFFDCEGLSIVA